MKEKEPFAMNCSDLNNPSVVSGGGAFAEYILPTDNSMISTSIGTTVLIKDSRDGNEVLDDRYCDRDEISVLLSQTEI